MQLGKDISAYVKPELLKLYPNVLKFYLCKIRFDINTCPVPRDLKLTAPVRYLN